MTENQRGRTGPCEIFSTWWDMMQCFMPSDWSCRPTRRSRLEYMERQKRDQENRIDALNREIERLRKEEDGAGGGI